jgi:D-glycero-alpha-D-manno-heptose-7-phosphate kinase
MRFSSPTRVDLAGGTLDCWPLYLLTESAVTLNLSVSIFTHVDIRPRPGETAIEIEVVDLGVRRSFADLEALRQDHSQELALVRAHVLYWSPPSGFHLRTQSESPVGGGLGGSSSLCISLIRAFAGWLKPDSSLSVDACVNLAHNL